MGPTIITDKNAIQSLSQTEIHFLFKYFYVNIPPILVREILGDLAKDNHGRTAQEAEVTILARKLLSNDSGINVHYHVLILNELMGNTVQMDFRTLRNSSKVTKDGKTGALINETDEERIVRNWQNGIFDNKDYGMALEWRNSINNISIDEIRSMSTHIIQNLKDFHINSLDNINELILQNFESDRFQQSLLTLIIEINKFNQEYATQIFYRWESLNKPSIKEFCPYAYYCIFAFSFWNLGTLRSLFGRATDIIDIEYLFYLPFTRVFVSNDNFHERIVPYLIQKNQKFITGRELKEDLKLVADKWKLLNDEEKIEWHNNYGSKPTTDTPLTFDLYNKYFVNQISVACQSEDEIEFMEIRRQIHIDSPCPCGSGVSYKNCHGK